LGGSFGGSATSAVWSDGGAGGSFSNNDGSTPSTATYTAAANSSSPVTLTLTTSGGFCGTTSNTKSLTVNAKETPSLTLSSDAAGPVNVETNVTLTAVASNTGGGTLSYIFKKAATILQAASSSDTYTAVAGSASFPAGATTTVFAELAISGGCVTSSTATSNNVSLEVIVGTTTSVETKESGKQSMLVWSYDKEVVVEGNGNLEVKVKDMSGRTIATGMGNASCVVKMSNSPAGLYMVFVNGIFAKKLVLQ
jgi:hypothetical protein